MKAIALSLGCFINVNVKLWFLVRVYRLVKSLALIVLPVLPVYTSKVREFKKAYVM